MAEQDPASKEDIPSTLKVPDEPTLTPDDIQVEYTATDLNHQTGHRKSSVKKFIRRSARKAGDSSVVLVIVGLLFLAFALILAAVLLARIGRGRTPYTTKFTKNYMDNKLADYVIPVEYRIKMKISNDGKWIEDGYVNVVVKIEKTDDFIAINCGDKVSIKSILIDSPFGNLPAYIVDGGYETKLIYSNQPLMPATYVIGINFTTNTADNPGIERIYEGYEVIGLISGPRGGGFARHILPCFDEPSFQTLNSISVEAPEDFDLFRYENKNEVAWIGSSFAFGAIRREYRMANDDSQMDAAFSEAALEFSQFLEHPPVLSTINSSLFTYSGNRACFFVSENYLRHLNENQFMRLICGSMARSAAISAVSSWKDDEEVRNNVLASKYFNCLTSPRKSRTGDNSLVERSEFLKLIRNFELMIDEFVSPKHEQTKYILLLRQLRDYIGNENFSQIEAEILSTNTTGRKWIAMQERLSEVSGLNCSLMFEALDSRKGYIGIDENGQLVYLSLFAKNSSRTNNPKEIALNNSFELLYCGQKCELEPAMLQIIKFYQYLLSYDILQYFDYLDRNPCEEADLLCNEQVTLNFWLLSVANHDGPAKYADPPKVGYFPTKNPTANALFPKKIITKIHRDKDEVVKRIAAYKTKDLE